MKIGIVGAGSFGCALASVLCKKYETKIFTRSGIVKNDIPEAIIVSDVKNLLDCDAIFICTPSNQVKSIVRSIVISEPDKNDKIDIVICSKGLNDADVGYQMEHPSFVVALKKDLPSNYNLSVFSGPNLAQEIVDGKKAITTIASQDFDVANRVCKLFENTNISTVVSNDVIGVQMYGASKNVIAMIMGIHDRLNQNASFNERQLLLYNVVSEVVDIIEMCGGKRETFMLPCGFNDLMLSCNTESRNYSFGKEAVERLNSGADRQGKYRYISAKGEFYSDLAPEGLFAYHSLINIARISQLYNVIDENPSEKEKECEDFGIEIINPAFLMDREEVALTKAKNLMIYDSYIPHSCDDV